MTEILTDPDAVHAALRQHAVLGQLDDAARVGLAAQMQSRHFAPREMVAHAKALGQGLGVVARGRIVLQSKAADSGAAPVLNAPGWFGAGVMPREAPATWSAMADGEVLVAFASAEVLAGLCDQHPWLRLFIAPPRLAKVPHEAVDPHVNLMQTPVRALLKRAPITVPPQTSIRDAARLMNEQRVSSVLLVDDGRLCGLVTDRDLRSRVVAEGLDTARPVIDIASLAPLTMDIGQPGFEALLLMARHNIHHVPVMDDKAVAGMITVTDVTEQHSNSAVFLAGDIHKQDTLEGLVACAAKVRALQRHLAAASASASATGHIVTAITDALTTQLLQLGELRFGPPPVDYAWVAAGSQARNEQTAKSDQDNCMILDDAYDAAAHGEYFENLATWVCDGLDRCGYVRCPGEMMAVTNQWRQPRRVWAEYFRKWVNTPDPMALMLTCVFFDVRTVVGRTDLLGGLRATVLKKTRGNTLFLGHMVGNALSRRPPLGLFGRLSTLRSGEHKGTIDLKLTGIVPVVDLARCYALAAGDDAVNTRDRLAHAADSGEISPHSVHDLRDALEYLSALRIHHQAGQIAANHAADNHLRPDQLSNFERSQLKDAFSVVKQVQDVLALRFQTGRA